MNEHEKMLLLKKNIPTSAYGANVTMFTITLEAWRRGLNVSFFTKNINNSKKLRYKISNETKSYTFSQSLNYNVVPKITRRTTNKKDVTKEKLIENNVPTPKGRVFSKSNDLEEMIEYATTLKFPLVLKPTTSSLGRGVVTNINTISDLKAAIQGSDLNKYDLLIEEQVSGEDVRMFVVGDKVVAAFKRVPSHILGDGEKSIKQLIKEKNKLRRSNPHTYKYQTKFDSKLTKYLKNKGLTLETVPKKNELITLTDTTLQSQGAETVDVTEKLSEESKQVAINATKLFPNLKVCGVDVMVDTVNNINNVLELNSRPYLGGGMFPLTGKGHDLPKAIIDLYFPETKETVIPIKLHYLYYDFDLIKKHLISGEIGSFVLPTLNSNEISYAKYYLDTTSFKRSFSTWLKNRAVAYHLNGHLKMIDKLSAELVVLGDHEHINNLLSKIKHYNNNQNHVKIVKAEEQLIQAVMVGFKIKKAPIKKAPTQKQNKKNSFLYKFKKRVKGFVS